MSKKSDLVAVKICGLRSPEQVDWVRESGASLAGLVFAESRRRVTVAVAQDIIAAARRADISGTMAGARGSFSTVMPGTEVPLHIVGVFARQSVDEVAAIATACQLDLVQLSGHEPATVTATLVERGLHVIVVVHVSEGMTVQEILMDAHAHERVGAEIILLDTASAQGGGSGLTFDWQVARDVVSSMSVPVMLAGGLASHNVAAAVRMVQPWGVDVSSGVEIDGVKDRARIAAFVHAAHESGMMAERGAE